MHARYASSTLYVAASSRCSDVCSSKKFPKTSILNGGKSLLVRGLFDQRLPHIRDHLCMPRVVRTDAPQAPPIAQLAFMLVNPRPVPPSLAAGSRSRSPASRVRSAKPVRPPPPYRRPPPTMQAFASPLPLPSRRRTHPCPATRVRPPRPALTPRRAPRATAGPAVSAAAALRADIAALAGAERGVFRVDTAARARLSARIADAKAVSPAAAPAADGAAAVGGAWRLLYTTLTILGRKRVKLAIGTKDRPGFVKLGEFYQVVDCRRRESRNIVVFDMALGGSGTFTIRAGFEVVGERRVAVRTESAELAPAKLEELLGGNIALLTEIFDPTGFLDITYLDQDLRVGRDDKGNVFVLERCPHPQVDAVGLLHSE
jgi:PAP_fibrillin